MKIGILTYNSENSYGAILQEYALQHYIVTEFNVQPDVIKYHRKDTPIINRIRNININKILTYKSRKKNRIQTNDILRVFENNNTFMSDDCNPNTFLSVANQYDTIIVGSDQVWNPYINYFDPNYLLDGFKGKKNSYAASVGVDTVNKRMDDYFKRRVDSFENISVREDKAVRIIKKYTGKEVRQNIDPTNLLVSSQWDQLCSNAYKGKDFIFVYALHRGDDMLDFVNKNMSNNSETIYYLGRELQREHDNIEILKDPTVEEFLSLIKYSKYVVTSSFHGICMSIVYEKDFFTILNNEKNNVNSRIISILGLYHLENRIINDDMSNNIAAGIDYHSVLSIKNSEINKSRLFIEKCLDV